MQVSQAASAAGDKARERLVRYGESVEGKLLGATAGPCLTSRSDAAALSPSHRRLCLCWRPPPCLELRLRWRGCKSEVSIFPNGTRFVRVLRLQIALHSRGEGAGWIAGGME